MNGPPRPTSLHLQGQGTQPGNSIGLQRERKAGQDRCLTKQVFYIFARERFYKRCIIRNDIFCKRSFLFL